VVLGGLPASKQKKTVADAVAEDGEFSLGFEKGSLDDLKEFVSL
jgi:hypothetical protein